MPSAAEIPVSVHLKTIPPVVRPMVQAARRTVKAVAPAAKEIAYRRWPLRYVVDGAYVVAIGTHSRWASLYFFRGRELDDRSGLLEGTGRDMRHIKLRTPGDVARPEVRRLLRRAFTLGGTPRP
ncbi:MAG: DUF1801 domain-containing protein [Chloroflexota bacterium]|nr:DUF1801 domain-containing protein [Chloroflexota bacterium]